MGRPAITTDKSGCREIVEDGKTGFLIRQRDLDSLVGALRKFINLSSDQKRGMGLAAHEKVTKEFDRDKVISEYLSKAEQLIGK